MDTEKQKRQEEEEDLKNLKEFHERRRADHAEKRKAASQQLEAEALRFDFKQLGMSIDVFKKILQIWKSDGKLLGFLYTDDPKHCEIFQECKKEHDKMIEKLVVIQRNLEKSSGNEAISAKTRELYMLCDGFRSMIDEVEVEESTIKYIEEIVKIYGEIETLLNE